VEPFLRATARKEDTGAIMTALSKLGGWQEPLERTLQHKGDPRLFVPVFVRSLRRLPPEKQVETAVLDAVSHSSHPQAVAFMLQVLRDPKAPVAWRQEAFSHLPGIGGARGLEAVRRARPARAERKPWFERVDLAAHARTEEQITRSDSRGRTWMLFQSVILGNWSDLFVVEKTASGWGRPLFTGAWTDRTPSRRAPTRFRGIPIAQLRNTEWIRIFPDDPTIREDSDGDGLTNVVEARLGTDPGKADMDGDGMGDAIDSCPNAAPRPLGDAEKIVAACVEARFFLQDWDAPAVLNVKDVQPFELYGYSSILLWPDDSRKQSQSGIFGDGMLSIGIYSPGLRSGRAPPAKGPSKRSVIEYDPDGKTARTSIYSYSGGVDGDSVEVKLKKMGVEWFVVDMEMHGVS